MGCDEDDRNRASTARALARDRRTRPGVPNYQSFWFGTVASEQPVEAARRCGRGRGPEDARVVTCSPKTEVEDSTALSPAADQVATLDAWNRRPVVGSRP
jgi:hypothetical protein